MIPRPEIVEGDRHAEIAELVQNGDVDRTVVQQDRLRDLSSRREAFEASFREGRGEVPTRPELSNCTGDRLIATVKWPGHCAAARQALRITHAPNWSRPRIVRRGSE